MDHVSPQPASQQPATPNENAAKIVGWHLVLGIAISLLAFGLFMGLADWVEDGSRGQVHFDRTILLWLHQHQTPWLTALARLLAIMGSGPVVVGIAVIATAFGFVYRHVRGAAWTLPLAVLGAGGLIEGLKLFVHRARPDLFKPLLVATGYSFPSGHSLISVVVYGLLGFFALHLTQKRSAKTVIVVVTVLVIVLVGVSRPYVGVHYPTDVLAGWSLGIPWLITCMGLHEVLSRRYRKTGEPVLDKPPAPSQAVDRHVPDDRPQ